MATGKGKGFVAAPADGAVPDAPVAVHRGVRDGAGKRPSLMRGIGFCIVGGILGHLLATVLGLSLGLSADGEALRLASRAGSYALAGIGGSLAYPRGERASFLVAAGLVYSAAMAVMWALGV